MKIIPKRNKNNKNKTIFKKQELNKIETNKKMIKNLIINKLNHKVNKKMRRRKLKK